MTLLPKDLNGCPHLILAPMEGVGDVCFRKAMASVGGFDEAVTEFLRVPANAHVQSLARRYNSLELSPIPLAAQLMGSDADLMAAMAVEIESRGAPRIDINCGCPSNTVTGKGAGSSLLKDPTLLHVIAKAVVEAVSIPVTVKMRSGYEDTSRFKENLLAAQESGIKYITLHPRTKVDGYGPPARWDLIAEAKATLSIPLVGNGDILTVDDAIRMLKTTGCDALMIGRGSIINPFIFQQIRAHFAGAAYEIPVGGLARYLETYLAEMPVDMLDKTRISKMKQLFSFLFRATPERLAKKEEVLRLSASDVTAYMNQAMQLL
jgi:nifR3 family TIM-barrel protein